MKRFKLLLVALATVSFGALTSCGGGETDDQATDTTAVEAVTEEPEVVTEELKDTTATEEVVNDSTKTEEATEEATEETTEEAK